VTLERPGNFRSPSGLAAVRDGTARVGPIAGIPDVLRDLGADPAEVLASAGVEPSLFDGPDNLIAFATLGSLLRVCVARTGCQHFGLLVGGAARISSLGLVGLLVQQSPSVGAALRDLVRHLHLQDRGAVPTLSLHGGSAMLGYLIYQPGVEATDQIYDGAMALGFNILRGLCGPAWRPTEVFLSHRRPSDPGPFVRLFQAPVHFDAEHSALVFPATWLEQPRAAADPALRRLLQEQVEAVESPSRDGFIGHVNRLLHAALPAGQCSMERVAGLLPMHRRTLNRRLRACGTTFQDLLEEARFGLARQLLQDTDLPLSQVASTLGYSDATAFTRAFRRWAGATPGAWRRTRAARG